MAHDYPKMMYRLYEQQLRTTEVFNDAERQSMRLQGWLPTPPQETAPTAQHPADILAAYLDRAQADMLDLSTVSWPEEARKALKDCEAVARNGGGVLRPGPPVPQGVTDVLQRFSDLRARTFRSPNRQVARIMTTMINEVKTGALEGSGVSMDDLLWYAMLGTQLTTMYESRGFDVPAWLPKRQREIERAITLKIELDIEAAEAEAEELEEKTKKRDAARARAEKLKALLPH